METNKKLIMWWLVTMILLILLGSLEWYFFLKFKEEQNKKTLICEQFNDLVIVTNIISNMFSRQYNTTLIEITPYENCKCV